MLLCDDIIFWHEHRQRPIATAFDLAMIECTVKTQEMVKEILGRVLKDAFVIALKKLARELKKDGYLSRD